jgi:hypothetical protein
MDSGNADADNQAELCQKLTDDWKAMADTQKVPLQFLKESESKAVDGKGVRPNVLAFFNKKLDINRFFIEDSDGQKAVQ